MIKQKFNLGDEFICRIDGRRGYVVLAFKGCSVTTLPIKTGGQIRIVPEQHLIRHEEEKARVEGELFKQGDLVRMIGTGKQLKILDIKQFYVVHFKNGAVKVLFQEVMAKATEKIIIPMGQNYHLRTFLPRN